MDCIGDDQSPSLCDRGGGGCQSPVISSAVMESSNA